MSKKTVLIVEDEPWIIASYLHLLEGLDEEVIPLATASYRGAREILAQESVDLIILDLILQDAKATDVLGELRKTHPNIPIFLVTGYPEEVDLEKANWEYLTKGNYGSVEIDRDQKLIRKTNVPGRNFGEHEAELQKIMGRGPAVNERLRFWGIDGTIVGIIAGVVVVIGAMAYSNRRTIRKWAGRW